MTSSETPVSAEEMIDALRRLQSQIPDYTQLSNEQIIALRRAATLSPEWVDIAVGAVGTSTTVQMILGSTFEDLRQEIESINRWDIVESQLRAMLRGAAGATLVRRHRVGLKLLQAYGIIRQLIRQPEHHELIPVYETLKQMNKLGRRKKKEEPEPVRE